MKGTDGNTYVPFTLTIDSTRVASDTVVVYLYVDDTRMAEGEDDDDREAVFEDAYFVEVDRDGDEPVHLSRAFSVPGGDYDVYVAVRDSLGRMRTTTIAKPAAHGLQGAGRGPRPVDVRTPDEHGVRRADRAALGAAVAAEQIEQPTRSARCASFRSTARASASRRSCLCS